MFLKFDLSTLLLVWTLLALHSLQATSECIISCGSPWDRAIICAEQNLLKIPQFINCEQAVSLDLTENRIENISRQDFVKLSGLNDHLYLAGNVIKEIFSKTFINLSILTARLYLQGNQLQRLEQGSFDGLVKLKVLNLDNNKLTEIESGVFNLPRVKRLYLANNVIQNISNGSFNGMKMLEELNLSNNVITTLLNNTFEGLRTVKKIDLSHNKIQVMEMSAFQDLASLMYLNLSCNEIVSVSAIHDLRVLDVLDLHLNSVTELNWFLNQQLISHNYKFDINVSSNPLDCECDSIRPLLGWYIKQQEVASSTGVNNNVAICSTPVNFRNERLSRQLWINCETLSPQSLTSARTLTSRYTASSMNSATSKTPTQSMAGTNLTVTSVIVGLLIICSVVLSYKSYRKYRMYTQSRPMVSAQLPNPTALTTRHPSPLPRLPVTPGHSIVPQRSISRHSMLALWSQGRIYFSRVRSSPRQSITHQPDRHDVSITGHLSAASTSTGFQTTRSSVSQRIPSHNSRHHESNIRAKPSAFFDRARITTTFSPRPRSQVESYITRIFTGNQRKRLQLQPVSQYIFTPSPNGDIVHTQDRWDVNTAVDDFNFSTAPYSPNHDTTRHWVQPSRVPLTSPMATEYPCDSSSAGSFTIHERRGFTPSPTVVSKCGPIGNHVKGYRTQTNHELRHKPLSPLDPDIITTTDQAPRLPSLAGHLILTNSCSKVSSNCSGLSTTVGKRDLAIVTQRPSLINNVKQTKRAWLQEDNCNLRPVTGCNATSTDQALLPPAPSIAGHLMASTSCSLMSQNHITPHFEKVSSGFSRIEDTTSSTTSVASYMNTFDTDPLSRSISSNHWSFKRNTKSCM